MLGHHIWFALWLYWPAGVATLLPVLAAHTPLLRQWSQPMDFGKTWRGHRLLGNNKTWRGFFAGWLGGSLLAWAQTVLYHHSSFVQSFYPAAFNPQVFIWVGILVSLGAVVGDAVASMVKRQLAIPSGDSWFPYDQIDFLVGGLLFSLAAARFSLVIYLLALAFGVIIHLLFGWLGYIMKLKPAII